MKNKILLIIDPQIDFISGSLPVPGAESAMNSLSEYIRLNVSDYSHIIVTADRHPMRHQSFASEGGRWPRHCVADSVGALIFPAIMDELLRVPDKVTILHKGENPGIEEYSIFKNKAAAKEILRIVETGNVEQIDICGLAGDVCVADTIYDGIELLGKSKFNVLIPFSPSIDGGTTLSTLIHTHHLSCVR